jgi:hypothetical protein
LPPGSPARYPDAVAEERAHQRESAMQAEWAAASGYQVSLRLIGARLETGSCLNFTVDPRPIGDGAATDASPFRWPCPGIGLNVLGSARISPPEHCRDAAQRRAELIHDPVFGAEQVLAPLTVGREVPADAAEGASFHFREVLATIAAIFGVPMISDAYAANNNVFLREVAAAARPRTLFDVLDGWAGRSHRVDRVGKLVRLRSRTWCLDRPQEVPLRLMRHCVQQFKEHGALPLAAHVQVATSLTDAQLDSPLGMTGRGPMRWPERELEQAVGEAFRGARGARHVLRLYASLSRTQQAALWRGETLPVSRLTPAQQELCRSALRFPRPMEAGEGEALGDGRLTLIVEPFEPPDARPMPAVIRPLSRVIFHLHAGAGAAVKFPVIVPETA